jgi:hypothetical protein
MRLRTSHSGVNAPPVLEFAEHGFDLVAVAIAQLIMRDKDFSVLF